MRKGGSNCSCWERLRARLDEAAGASRRALERIGLHPFAQPAGGMFVWAALPGHEDAAPLAREAAAAGIMLAPGSVFRPRTQVSPYLRFNVAHGTDRRLLRFLDSALAHR